jgi:beta-lactamase class C
MPHTNTNRWSLVQKVSYAINQAGHSVSNTVQSAFSTTLHTTLLTALLTILLTTGVNAANDIHDATNNIDNVTQHSFVSALEQQIFLPVTQNTPGAALLVVLDGRIVLEKAYGIRHKDSKEPINTRTLFRIASISKTFASAAAAILVEEEPIAWDTPVTQSLNKLRFKRDDYGQQINLYHLMSQSTGLMPHAYTNLIEDNMSYQRIIKRLDRVDFICAPGDCYGYQNVVFSLVGDVIKATTNKSYTSYVDEKLFTPLQMDRASFGLQAFLNDENHAEPHVRRKGDWKPTRTTHHYYTVPPAAGVNASIVDMREWMLAQLGQKPDVLSGQLLDQIQSGAIPTSPRQAHYRKRSGLENIHYGLGWRVFDYKDQQGFVHHGGYVRGMRSEMLFNRELQMGFVFLTNSEPREMGDMVFEFLDLYKQLSTENQLATAFE